MFESVSDLTTRDAVRTALDVLLKERRPLKFGYYGLAVLKWSHPAFQLEVDFTKYDDHRCDIDVLLNLHSQPEDGDKAVAPYEGLKIAFATPACRYEVMLTRGEPLRCFRHYLWARFEDVPLDVACNGWFELPPA